jgi:hypothetical protein
MCALEHGCFGGKEEIGRKMRAVDVVLAQSCVGFGDADELDLGVRWEAVEEALNVTVDETDDGYADWRSSLSGCRQWCEEVYSEAASKD